MDKLKAIWKAQKEQQESFGLTPDTSTLDKRAMAKDYVIGMLEEVSELAAASTNFKAHILKSSDQSVSAILEEAVDVAKYLFSLMHLYGITSDEFHQRFIEKTEVIRHRAEAIDMELTSDTKLIAMDLDGCVVDLQPLDDELDVIARSGDSPSSILAQQESVKFEWREQGKFLDLPPIKDAIRTVKCLKNNGYQIAIITARPQKQHKRLYSDTIRWLQKYHVPYDLLLFGRDKAEMICDHLKPAFPQYFIEDRVKHALEVAALGIPVLLLDLSRKKEIDMPLVKIVKSWSDLAYEILEKDDE